MDWQAALGEDALRLQPRSVRQGGERLRVRLRAEHFEEAEHVWLREREADGTVRDLVHVGGELELDFDTSAVWLEREGALPRLCSFLANVARAPRPRPRIMGIVNVTPDSFSDGGRYLDPERAIEHGLQLAEVGAELLDVGGESTRPGAEPVELEEELRRVVPVVRELARRTRAEISVDTQKSAVASAALDAGASIVNDVSAGRSDPQMLATVAERGARCVLMHMLGTPHDMQSAPRYAGDVVALVLEFLRERAAACWRAGIDPARLYIDPGIGFGKDLDHNLALLARARELTALGIPLAIGPSRKSFIAKLEAADGRTAPPEDREGGTAAAVCAAVNAGAAILRVHDVRTMSQAARVAFALAERAR